MTRPKRAGVVQWQNSSFPSCIRGFDSLHPLQYLAVIHRPVLHRVLQFCSHFRSHSKVVTGMRHRLKFLVRLIWHGSVIGLVVTIVGLVLPVLSLAGSLFGYSGDLPWWTGLAIGAPLFLGATAWTAASKAYDLEEAARPCLVFGEINQTERPHQLHSTIRQFEIEIFNDSQTMLDDCCVNLTQIEPLDRSQPCVDQLPRALLTRGNHERNGEGRFRLRPHQPKRLLLCRRVDGRQQEIDFSYEGKKESYWAFSTIQCVDVIITLEAYGAPTPTIQRLRLSVDSNHHKLHIEKVV